MSLRASYDFCAFTKFAVRHLQSHSSDLGEYYNFLQNERLAFPDKYMMKSSAEKNREDFDIIRTLGVGTFGKVLLVQDKSYESPYYAMKLLVKEYLVKSNQVRHTLCEKRILQSLNFTFTVNLVYFFMDNSYMYLIMPFIAGGELFRLFRNVGSFSETDVKFYSAQVLLALQYLHNFDVLYRDLKPENLLIDEKGNLKLTDFGLSKIVTGRTYTFCGTPDYIAPEIILNKGYGKSVDYWSLGVLIFELCSGRVPFFAVDLERLYETIVRSKFYSPPSFTRDLKDLLRKLITHDITRRLGNLKDGILDIMRHHWFKEINWMAVLNCQATPPFIPEISDPKEAENFDTQYDEPIEFRISQTDKYRAQFVAF